LKNAKERMDVIAAYRDVGTYRGAAEICGTTHKAVKRIIETHQLISEGGRPPDRVSRASNYARKDAWHRLATTVRARYPRFGLIGRRDSSAAWVG
jgi:hypothetical protein